MAEEDADGLDFSLGQKRGVPTQNVSMLPGNSFPQICVVSVNKSVENENVAQEYKRSMR
jgi:hypothetical protein